MPDVLNATVQATPKDGSRTFHGTDGSAAPVEVLVHPINSAHDLVVVFDQEWLADALPLPIRSRPSFGFPDWVDTMTPTLLETQLMALLWCLPHD